MSELLDWREVGAGSALLLVHGDFSNGRGAWDAQMTSLAPYHRLLIPDRRGHGASLREPRPYTIAGDAGDLLAVLDAAGVDAFHLAGHSYGGLVAIELAGRAPGRIRSLHLIEPPMLALLPDHPDVKELDAAVRRIRRATPERGPEWAAEAFFRLLASPGEFDRLRASAGWPTVVAAGARLAAGQPAGDYPPAALDRLGGTYPVIVYRGGRSHPGLRAVAAELARRIPRGRLVEVPGVGHAVQRSGEPFDRALLEVTRRLDRRDPAAIARRPNDGAREAEAAG